MAGKIFISYRREDSSAHARSIELALKQAFGDDHVFMDVDDIAPGDDFSDSLSRMLKRCKVMLVVIGPEWLRILNEREKAHFRSQSHDYIRIEIGEALRSGKRVIPVLVGGGKMPDQMELYGELLALGRHQAVELRHGQFNADMEQLVKSLYSVVGRPFRVRNWGYLAAGAASLSAMAGLYVVAAPQLGLPQFGGKSSGGTPNSSPIASSPVSQAGCSFEPFSGAVFPGGTGTIITLTSNPAGPCQLRNVNAQGQPPANLALRRNPRSGEVNILPSGIVSYMPAKDFAGLDHFAYHSTSEPYAVAVMVRVQAPGQATPKTTMTDFDGTCSVHQFIGGSLPGGAVAAMTVRNTGKPCPIRNFYSQNLLVPGLEIVRPPRNGEATVTGDGFVAYTPKPGFAGRDYFAYHSTARQFAVVANVVVLPVK